MSSIAAKIEAGVKPAGKIHIPLKWLRIPLVALITLAIAIGLLYSADRTFLVFAIILGFIAILVEPFIGALLYVVLLYTRPMEIISATRGMPLMRYLALGTLGIWLIHVVIHRKRDFVKAPQNYLMLAFLVILVVSQRTYVHGIIDILIGDFAKIVIIYFLLVNLVNTEKRLQVTIWILMLSTLWVSIHSILLSRGIVIGDIELSQGTRVTSSGIFGDPNDLAQAIVVAIPFVFNLFFHERSALKKLILGVTGVIMLYAFLLTGSRGGFIGLAVVMFFLLRKKAGIFLGSAFALIALVGLLFVAPSSTVDRVRTISPYDDTGGARIQLWYEGWQMFLSNPIMGVGKDNFVEHEPTRHVAHNSFVHVAAELGFIGLFIWIGLLYFSFKALNNTRKLYVNVNNVLFSDPGHRTSDSELPELSRAHVLSDSLMVSMIGFASTAFFLSRQYEYLPYILIALSVALYQLANKDKGLKLAFSIEELRNVLLVTFMFLVVWSGILKAFA